MTPEKLHLALNHFVFLLPMAALIPLVAGLLLRNRPTIICGLVIAALGSVMTGLVMGTGEDAYERYKDGPVTEYLDEDFYEVLEHHEHLAHDYSKVMYGLLAASVVAIAIAFLKPKFLSFAVIVVALLCVASVIVGVLIADSGGDIRRPDFRTDFTDRVEELSE